jgi:Protein of unknown function (DUF4239)
MLSLIANIVFLALALIGARLFLAGLNRLWPVHKRSEHNDLIGWQLNILGTTYAVILGFMLYAEWTNFTTMRANVDLEASALRNVFRIAEGLPVEQRGHLEAEARSYADAVLKYDWPEMAAGETPEESHAINQQMWKTLISVKAATPSEATAEDHALSELSTLTSYRRTRLLSVGSRLPGIFWTVLIVGGVLTLVSVSLFGPLNSRLHTVQVLSFTFFITLVMLAIADVGRPFGGWVHISDYPFQRAQQNMLEPT